MTQKKKVPRRVPFYATSLRLVAAAGAGQVLQRQSRAVYRRTAAPAVGARTHVAAGRRIGGQRRNAIYHRCQRYSFAVNVGLDPRCDQYHDLAVGIGLDLVHVLRRSAGHVLAAPVIRCGRRAAGLVHLGNRSAACACGQDHLGHLRPDGVVLVRGERHRSQNTDDRNHDHQLDQGKALLNRSHGNSPSLSRRYGVRSLVASCMPLRIDYHEPHDSIACYLIFPTANRGAEKRFRAKIRHSMTPHVTVSTWRILGLQAITALLLFIRGQAKSRSESRYLGFVDLVDLIGVEESLGVTQVDLLANEYVEQIRVDVPVQPEVSEDPEGLGKRFTALVRPVLGGQRLENIGDSHDPRLHRHLLPLQSTRVALPVHALVVTAGVLRHFGQVFGPRQRFQHLDGGDDVVIDRLSLLAGECTAGDREIPDLVLGEKIGSPPRDVYPFVARANPVHALLRLRRHGFSADVAVTQEFAVAIELTRGVPRRLVDLRQALASTDLVQPRFAQDFDFLFQCLYFQIALQHLETRVHVIDSVEDRFQLGRLVHDVHGSGHLPAVVQQTRYLELVAVLVAHDEIPERPLGGLVDSLGKHHGELRDAFAVPPRVGGFLIDRFIDELDKGLE